MRPQERPLNAQECQKCAQEQPKRTSEDKFQELLMDFENFQFFFKVSECPKRGQDVPRGLLERSWDLFESSCEAFGRILVAFGECFEAILELGERFRSDFPKYRKTFKNTVRYCKIQGSTCQKFDEKSV